MFEIFSFEHAGFAATIEIEDAVDPAISPGGERANAERLLVSLADALAAALGNQRGGGAVPARSGAFGSGAACQFTPAMVLRTALAASGDALSSPSQVDQASSSKIAGMRGSVLLLSNHPPEIA